MILASANAAISPGGMARGGWRPGRRRKERVSSCGSVWGRIAPPPDEEFVGGGFFWAFEDNDGDSDHRGFKAGTLDVTMLTRWCYDESAVGRGLCPLAGVTTSRRRFRQQCSLAGSTTSRWRVGRRCSPAGATTGWRRVTQRCSPAGATMSRRRGRWRCSLAGATKSRRQDGRQCLPTGATKSRRWGGRWYSLACVTMLLTAGRTMVLLHRRSSLAHWCDDELVMGPMAVLARWHWAVRWSAVLASWRDDKLVAGRTTVLARWRYDESAAGRTTVLALWRADSRWQGGRLEEHPQRATIDATINSVWSSGSRTACVRPREC
jgi:hypothetical protein